MSGVASAMGMSAATASVISTIGTVVSLVGTVSSMFGSTGAGDAANAAAKSQAIQLEQRANSERAVAQRQAVEEARKANIVSSRAKSLIAGGGGDTTDVGSQDIFSGIDAEADYRKMTALYNGEVAATGSEYAAQVARAEGKAKQRAGIFNAGSTLISGGSSIYDRFSPASAGTVSVDNQDDNWDGWW